MFLLKQLVQKDWKENRRYLFSKSVQVFLENGRQLKVKTVFFTAFVTVIGAISICLNNINVLSLPLNEKVLGNIFDTSLTTDKISLKCFELDSPLPREINDIILSFL